MRSLYLTCYDVCDAKRLRKMFKVMRGFGNHLQYSVFLCELNPSEKIQMLDRVRAVMHEREDSFLILRMGPVGEISYDRIEFLGRRPEEIPTSDSPMVI